MSVIIKNGFQYYSSYNEQFKEVTLEEYKELEKKGLIDSKTVYCVNDYNDVISADKINYNDETTLLNATNVQDAVKAMNLKNSEYFDLFRFQNFYRDNISIAASTSGTYEFNVAKEGYTPIGVIGWQSDNASSSGGGCSMIHMINFWRNVENNIVGIGIRNYRTSTSKIKLTIKVMYMKSDFYEKYQPITFYDA